MATNNNINNVVIVGGGTAGWLTAGVLAATLRRRGLRGVSITLIESPDISTIGVGEGTWPSMRTTLQSIGIRETDFIRCCDAAFKQGTCFRDWRGTGAADEYLHPFTLPHNYHERNPVTDWVSSGASTRFSDAVSAQGPLASQGYAPKSITTPEYAFYLNYGYHLNAGKFAELLREHCITHLGVEHQLDQVSAVVCDDGAFIDGLELASGRRIRGDFFVDCSGLHGLLLDRHFRVPMKRCDDVLFNDTALAAQVPYTDPEQPVASYTLSTARDAGWIWDIGLSSRRGTGYVYSSRHSDDEHAAQVLKTYLRDTATPDPDIELRKISFTPGYREQFWVKNCVAVGMASGFIEPLEASALVLVELSAKYIAEDFPVNRDMMDAVQRRFNRRFTQHWEMIIDFLKLHYVLSGRQGGYWDDHRAATSIPESLRDRLTLWAHRPPWHQDAIASDDMFPPASYQYILYGMGFPSPAATPGSPGSATETAGELVRLTDSLRRTLPKHRDLLERIRDHGLPTV